MTGLIQGSDYSHFQEHVDPARLVAQGVRFVGIQFTIGTGNDALGQQHVKDALAAGLKVLPYAFLNGDPGKASADHFLSELARGGLTNHPGVLPTADIEPKQGCKRATVEDFYTEYLAHAAAPVTYTGPGAYAAVMGGRNVDIAKRFGLSILWSADYRGPRPVDASDQRFRLHFVGEAYGYGGFTAAQIVQYGPFHGIDGDVFAGTDADLAALFGTTSPTGPTVHYRYGGIPAWRGGWKTLAHVPVLAGPGSAAKRITTLSPGKTFAAAQSLRRPNGRLWLGDATGLRWVLADKRVVKVAK